MKIAGRDAGKRCVVVDVLDKSFVMVDGETRRRKVNVRHLEPLAQLLEIGKSASHDDVKVAFATLGLKTWETKAKEKKEKPRKARNAKVKAAPEKKTTTAKKKTAKKEAVVEEKKE